MSRNVRLLKCAPGDVFRVLENGWLYPTWVVGASRMRDVDGSWPAPRARLHHSVGVWPVLIDDDTECLAWDPPRRMAMRARGWPIGEARVTIDVKPLGTDACLVRIQEEAVSGPARYVPAPILDAALHWRNTETLHRLAYLAEGMRRVPSSGATSAEREEGGEPFEEPDAPRGGA
ncbi:MAG TPA: SRPBCC family protein [Microbacterium sp.]|uniref:SRPBCC family protein n=1 Tax=Microbacterium sp. TaxID=51671 RepID=UPI002B8D6CE8|nr:SRPBCC family protein [Microbacterium sp.]HWI30502.1 SRPBCC family protein [Microbacterium sp.]